ncbi:Uncharacterised protein [Pantoea agglomerans]|uniref:Uncharacterized protein n=1 Tax=Enterobacter agglomerans TaxID=549 RepID=A0A379AJA3_ENTAG|nr:Uncharacterised protein [Pantoea agglomerans]
MLKLGIKFSTTLSCLKKKYKLGRMDLLFLKFFILIKNMVGTLYLFLKIKNCLNFQKKPKVF